MSDSLRLLTSLQLTLTITNSTSSLCSLALHNLRMLKSLGNVFLPTLLLAAWLHSDCLRESLKIEIISLLQLKDDLESGVTFDTPCASRNTQSIHRT